MTDWDGKIHPARIIKRAAPRLRVYVASSWRNEARHQAMVMALRRAGHTAYDFRESGFSWSDCADEAALRDPKRFRDEVLTTPVAKEGFRRDMDALEQSQATVLVLPCGLSSHLELGYAVGAGQRTIVLFGDDPYGPELMYLMCSKICMTVDEVIQELEKL